MRGVRRVLVEMAARLLERVAGHLLTAPNMMCGEGHAVRRNKPGI